MYLRELKENTHGRKYIRGALQFIHFVSLGWLIQDKFYGYCKERNSYKILI